MFKNYRSPFFVFVGVLSLVLFIWSLPLSLRLVGQEINLDAEAAVLTVDCTVNRTEETCEYGGMYEFFCEWQSTTSSAEFCASLENFCGGAYHGGCMEVEGCEGNYEQYCIDRGCNIQQCSYAADVCPGVCCDDPNYSCRDLNQCYNFMGCFEGEICVPNPNAGICRFNPPGACGGGGVGAVGTNGFFSGTLRWLWKLLGVDTGSVEHSSSATEDCIEPGTCRCVYGEETGEQGPAFCISESGEEEWTQADRMHCAPESQDPPDPPDPTSTIGGCGDDCASPAECPSGWECKDVVPDEGNECWDEAQCGGESKEIRVSGRVTGCDGEYEKGVEIKLLKRDAGDEVVGRDTTDSKGDDKFHLEAGGEWTQDGSGWFRVMAPVGYQATGPKSGANGNYYLQNIQGSGALRSDGYSTGYDFKETNCTPDAKINSCGGTMTVGESTSWSVTASDPGNDLKLSGAWIQKKPIENRSSGWKTIGWRGNLSGGNKSSITYNTDSWRCDEAGTYELVVNAKNYKGFKCGGNPTSSTDERCASGQDKCNITCTNPPSPPTCEIRENTLEYSVGEADIFIASGKDVDGDATNITLAFTPTDHKDWKPVYTYNHTPVPSLMTSGEFECPGVGTYYVVCNATDSKGNKCSGYHPWVDKSQWKDCGPQAIKTITCRPPWVEVKATPFEIITGVDDEFEIITPTIPDDRPIYKPGDTNGDGLLDFTDIIKFIQEFNPTNDKLDVNGDGETNLFDYNAMIRGLEN